jgi:hypothetical protein
MTKSYIRNIVFLLITILTFGLVDVQAQTYRILPLGNSITVGWNGAIPPMDEAVSYRSTLFDQLTTQGYLFDFVGHTSAGSVYMSDPEHGAISSFRGQHVVRLLQDGFDELSRLESDLFSPMDKTLGGPFGPFLVGFGHVFFDGGMPPLPIAADMAGHPFVFVKALDDSGCKAHVELFCDQLMGHTVIMPLDFNVIVDMDPGLFPLGILIRTGRQRL